MLTQPASSLPTEAELEAVLEQLGHAFSAAERIVLRLSAVDSAALADIGMLALFASDVRGRGDELHELADRVERAFVSLDELRRAAAA